MGQSFILEKVVLRDLIMDKNKIITLSKKYDYSWGVKESEGKNIFGMIILRKLKEKSFKQIGFFPLEEINNNESILKKEINWKLIIFCTTLSFFILFIFILNFGKYYW